MLPSELPKTLGEHTPGLQYSFTDTEILEILKSPAHSTTDRLKWLRTYKRQLQKLSTPESALQEDAITPSPKPTTLKPRRQQKEWRPKIQLPKDFDNRSASFYTRFIAPKNVNRSDKVGSEEHPDVAMNDAGNGPDGALKVK